MGGNVSCSLAVPSAQQRQSVRSGKEIYVTHRPSLEKCTWSAEIPPRKGARLFDCAPYRANSPRDCTPTAKIFDPPRRRIVRANVSERGAVFQIGERYIVSIAIALVW